MSRNITIQFDLEVPDDGYDYGVDDEGRIEYWSELVLGEEMVGVTTVSTSGPNGSGYVGETAVVQLRERTGYDHNARPCDDPLNSHPEKGQDCCKDCGEPIHDAGSDGWMHNDDLRNR